MVADTLQDENAAFRYGFFLKLWSLRNSCPPKKTQEWHSQAKRPCFSREPTKQQMEKSLPRNLSNNFMEPIATPTKSYSCHGKFDFTRCPSFSPILTVDVWPPKMADGPCRAVVGAFFIGYHQVRIFPSLGFGSSSCHGKNCHFPIKIHED